MNKVQEFYNITPFPDYELDRFNSKEDLMQTTYSFADVLDRSIPEDASIIDVGTGTGQLSAYLSLRRKCVYGIDFSGSSLNKARKLKEKLKLNSLTLKKVDIMKPIKINKQFDYVLCLGVLHHTENAYKAFENIIPLMKKDSKIAIGLYNRYGRMPLNIRKFLAKTIFRNNQKVKEYFIKLQIGNTNDKERARGWWNDQYKHPHETTHTIGEVLKWFRKNNINFTQLIPNGLDIGISGVWNEDAYPNFFNRVLKQLDWIYSTHHEGGYFVMFGENETYNNKQEE